LWVLGFPDQALKYNTKALALAQELSHPFNLVAALEFSAFVHVLRGETHLVRERSEAALPLSTEFGFSQFLAWGPMHQGWALWKQGHHKSGIDLFRKGLSLFRPSAPLVWVPFYLGLLAELYGKEGQAEEGVSILAEACQVSSKKEAYWCEAELYRLKGELTLQKEFTARRLTFNGENSQFAFPNPQLEAETCFLTAIDIAQKQQAKSWELRASTSLARLWQQQGKRAEAHKLLSDIYNWFTEGFDTKDLQEAKALLEELSH
jgi:predicted ATPase